MKAKRGSIELSTSTLVVIITGLSLVLLGLAAIFVWTGGVNSLKEYVDVSTQEKSIEYIPPLKLQNKNESNTTPIVRFPSPQTTPDCLHNFSCDSYFIYIPLGDWHSQALFETKARERAVFFTDISEFKFKQVGMLFMPLNFTVKCNLDRFNSKLARDHARIKKCADIYADTLGIDYERAIALSPLFDGGRAFFRSKVMYASLGYTVEEQKGEAPSIVAHELGHTYSLCDEYSLIVYTTQDRYFNRNTCLNSFPTHCRKNETKCLGNTPPHRDYAGKLISNVCEGDIHYSVMGASSGSECGYDPTGGYLAIGDFQ